jgi:hypothetical protein
MKNVRTGRRAFASLIRPVVYAVATALAGGVFAGAMWGAIAGRSWPVPLAAAVLALLAVLGLLWLSRAGSVWRLRAAADAFAEREIARERRRKAAEAEPRLS